MAVWCRSVVSLHHAECAVGEQTHLYRATLGKAQLQVLVSQNRQFHTVFEFVLHHSLHVVLAKINLVETVVLRQKREDAVWGLGKDIANAGLRE